jgi:hypothetical protein
MNRRSFLLSTLAAPAVLRAQKGPARAKELIGKIINALGGDAFRYMQTRLEAGRAYSFYNEQLSGLSIARIYTHYLRPEARPPEGAIYMEQRQVFGKKQDIAALLTPKSAYEITFRGARDLGEERVQQFHETTLRDVFYMLRVRLDEPGFGYDALGTDVVENQTVEGIDFYDNANRQVTVWFNSHTLLPVKQRFLRFDEKISARREEITRYAKYRDIGNRVMWPFDIQRERDGEKIYQMFSEQARVGESVDSSMFQLPPGIPIINNSKKK